MSILSFLTLAREPSVTGRLTLTMAAVEPKRRHFQSISKNVLKYAAEHCGEQAAKHWKVKSFKKLKFLNRNGFALWPQWLRRTQGDRPWLLPACERKKFDIKFAIVFVISTQNIFILRCELILWCECSRRGLHFVYYSVVFWCTEDRTLTFLCVRIHMKTEVQDSILTEWISLPRSRGMQNWVLSNISKPKNKMYVCIENSLWSVSWSLPLSLSVWRM